MHMARRENLWEMEVLNSLEMSCRELKLGLEEVQSKLVQPGVLEQSWLAQPGLLEQSRLVQLVLVEQSRLVVLAQSWLAQLEVLEQSNQLELALNRPLAQELSQ
jgi:hypothetical protein